MSVLSRSAVATFIAAKETEAARDFYENKLGLTVLSEDDWGVMYDANGTTVRLQKGIDFTPHEFTVLGWHVEDIEGAKAELEARGVIFEIYPWLPEGSNGIMTFPGGARVCWFKDPHGNVLSLDQL